MNSTQEMIYSLAINFFEEKDEKTSEMLDESANEAREILGIKRQVSDEEFEEILGQLHERISVHMTGQEALIKSHSTDYKPWLYTRKADISWKFWDRYKRFLLQRKCWPQTVVNSIDDSSNKILDLLGNPDSKEGFLRKGLVIGDVQSGKTATYTSICNKAADAGYRVIIVLTGIQEDLRKQTQARLDAEFAGASSADTLNSPGKRGRKAKVGVAEFDNKTKLVQLTSTIKDFDINIARNIQMDIKSLSQPVLFVMKKQKDVLKNLTEWLQNSIDTQTGKINQPLLLIDDEADNASINTRDEDDPTTINSRIRDLMALFNQVSYIGVTATPFANIFIQPELDTDNDDKITAEELSQADLFPSDFIYALDTPNNYIGARQIFGEDVPDDNESGKYKYFLQEIDTDEMEEYLPYKHKKDTVLNKIPVTMKRALYYFLLVNAVLDYRKKKKTHRSMMIHVSRFVNVQNQLGRLVNDWLHEVRSEIENYAALPKKDKKVENNIVLNELKTVYEEMGLQDEIDWHKLRRKYLMRAVVPIEVRIQNGDKRNKESLDYQHYPDGLRVIVVGGNSLSRGLTLEGLCVTFFYRRSIMYDTLLQMGRWFGYRQGYDDLCRIWLSPEAISWYRYITEATEDLKDQIREMQRLHQTPSEFGLKVRQNPASLIVTARNKMKNAYDVKQAVSIAGRMLESPRLLYNEEILSQNYDVFKKFIRRLPAVYDDSRENNADKIRHPRLFWRGIKSSNISQLLQEYQSSLWHMDFQGNALSTYIMQNMQDDLWDVAIVDPKKEEKSLTLKGSCSPITIYPIPRHVLVSKDTDTLLVSGTKVRIGSVGLTKYGLREEEVKRLERKFLADHPGKKAAPDKAFLQTTRNPILFVYMIRSTDPLDKISKHTPLCALGLGFPGNGRDERIVQYKVNVVAYRNMLGDDIDLDEYEDE